MFFIQLIGFLGIMGHIQPAHFQPPRRCHVWLLVGSYMIVSLETTISLLDFVNHIDLMMLGFTFFLPSNLYPHLWPSKFWSTSQLPFCQVQETYATFGEQLSGRGMLAPPQNTWGVIHRTGWSKFTRKSIRMWVCNCNKNNYWLVVSNIFYFPYYMG
jgi:hypothetical protein